MNYLVVAALIAVLTPTLTLATLYLTARRAAKRKARLIEEMKAAQAEAERDRALSHATRTGSRKVAPGMKGYSRPTRKERRKQEREIIKKMEKARKEARAAALRRQQSQVEGVTDD